ncbi:type I secretion system permease/ATPase [Devosia sp. D6-9]|nr:type I secretion system permease/ATPase [Devosia sp. D6-9]
MAIDSASRDKDQPLQPTADAGSPAEAGGVAPTANVAGPMGGASRPAGGPSPAGGVSGPAGGVSPGGSAGGPVDNATGSTGGANTPVGGATGSVGGATGATQAPVSPGNVPASAGNLAAAITSAAASAERAAAADAQAAPVPVDDPLLSVVRYLAMRWSRPTAPEVLTAGLPLVDGKLTFELLPRALERVGLTVTQKRTALRDLPEFDMPAIISGKHGQIMVCVGRAGRHKLRCYDPEAKAETIIATNTAEWRFRHRVLLVKQAVDADDSADELDDGSIKETHWLRAALQGHWGNLAYVLIAATFINIFAVAMPLFSMNVYDRVLPNKAVSTLWVLAIGIVTVFVFDFLLKIARAAIIDHAGRVIDFRLSSVLFDRVLNTSVAARPASTGAFVNRITQYEVLRDFFTSQTVVMFVDILFMGVFVYVIAMLIGWVVIFPVLAALMAIVGTIIIGIRSKSVVEAALKESSQRNAILVEALSATQTVKASRAEGQFLRKWESSIFASSETQNKIKWYQSVATQLTSVISQVSTIGIMIGATYSFAENQVTMGAIVAAMMLSNRVIAPVAMISAALLRTRSAMEAYTALDSIMKLPDERKVKRGFVTRSVESGKIEFRKVRFAYPGIEHYVLDQVSFTINPGEKVGIIGRIGSGKTTLGRLLVNFYPASEGEILIDGVSIKQYHPASLRRQVGLVLQDPELFNGSVKDNILLSNPEASEQHLLEVSRRAGVEEFVSRHPLGYDMPVGERGFLLSGGQRQAVALARTMLVDPKILFLDEPSSSMDLATERQLIGALSRTLAADHTVLIATHRFSLLQLVTRLMVVDNGRIVADGPRDAVLAQLRAQGNGGEGAA